MPRPPAGRGALVIHVYRNVLIICHANTSRSIIAQELLRKMLIERGLQDHISVRSGGIATYARDGALVSMDARLVLREEGIHVPPESVSTDLKRNPYLVAAADLILAMTREQIRLFAAVFPDVVEKEIYTLKSFAGGDGDIEDPVGKGEDVFAACRDEIKACLQRAIHRITGDAG